MSLGLCPQVVSETSQASLTITWVLVPHSTSMDRTKHAGVKEVKDTNPPAKPPWICFSGFSMLVEVLLYVRRNRRFIRDGSPGRPPRLSHSS